MQRKTNNNIKLNLKLINKLNGNWIAMHTHTHKINFVINNFSSSTWWWWWTTPVYRFVLSPSIMMMLKIIINRMAKSNKRFVACLFLNMCSIRYVFHSSFWKEIFDFPKKKKKIKWINFRAIKMLITIKTNGWCSIYQSINRFFYDWFFFS